jgi:parallel beta-helix repeat protein
MNMMKTHGYDSLDYILYQMRKIFLVLEDVYSVGSMVELQEAIDSIGTGAGTIFIEAGTHTVNTTIDIDNCGSIVIYGHGDNTILLPDDGITVFNITCCASLLIKTLRIDTTNYTGATQAIIVNETNDNIVGFEDVSIGGLVAGFGIGIELQSNNCYIDKCNIIYGQQGVYVNGSENSLITNNVIGLNAQYGIYVDTVDVCTISGNSLVSNTIHGIYVHDSAYIIMSHNGCFNNLQSGIYLDQSDYNTISACACNGNFQNGIYIGNISHYNTISSNTCSNNDSNTANPQGGIVIADNSDYNTISGNSCNNNNNAGAGTGYGIIIQAATCLESVVAANNANGNDVDFQDSGTDTVIEYYVQDEFELQDAINSIGTKSGTINLEGSFTITATIIIDVLLGGGSYIIRGAGSNTTLTTGDNQCFNISSARSVLLENFKIDASAITGRNTTIIEIDEAADNLVKIDNITITGIVARGWGIECISDNIQVRNCYIETIDMGIVISGDNCLIENNTCTGMDEYGINITGDYCVLSNNICSSSNVDGIQMNLAHYCIASGNQCTGNAWRGLYVFNLHNTVISDNVLTGNQVGLHIDRSDYVNVTGNTASSNTVSGIRLADDANNNFVTGNTCESNTSYGIIIGAADCDNNIVRNNNCVGNLFDVWDTGTNSDFEYRCSTDKQIQDAVDSIALKSGLITLLADTTFVISTTIDIDGGGAYIIQGQGDNTILVPDSDISVFNITAAKSLTISDFKIDASALTTPTKGVIIASEVSHNNIILERLTIIGNSVNGYGIQITKNYVDVRNCNISTVNYGIYTTGSYGTFQENVISTMANDGIYLTASTYNIISDNRCTACKNGISLNATSTYNTLTGNRMDANTLNGIYMDTANYNSFVGNSLISNVSNTINSQGAFYLNANCDQNSFTSNIIYGNTNGGVGITYGIYIAVNTSNKNTFTTNKLDTNEVNWKDNGENNEIEYRCSTGQEIQDAIDSIAAKSGIINLMATIINLTAPIDVDGGGKYIIQGTGETTIVAANGNRNIITITNAAYCMCKDFAIDRTGQLATSQWGISILEIANNKVIIENIYVSGEAGLGFVIASNNIIIRECYINGGSWGIRINGTPNPVNNIKILNNRIENTLDAGGVASIYINMEVYDMEISGNRIIEGKSGIQFNSNNTAKRFIITNNHFYSCSYAGVYLGATDECVFSNNIFDECNIGIDMWGAAATWYSDYNLIMGNIFEGIVTFGVVINHAFVRYTNIIMNQGLTISDAGLNTYIFGDDTVYGASWDTNLGTATKNAIYDKIQLVIAGAAANAFTTITGITDDVVADGVADTLTLAAVGGLTIVGTAVTDTITFENTITQYTDLLAVAAVEAARPMIYYVDSDAELDAAITAIETGNQEGRIIITVDLTNVQATLNDASASYIIEGSGSGASLDANGNNAVITITNCASCVIRNLKIDAADHTAVGTPVIDINGGSNITIENVHILGDNVNSIGITVNTTTKVQLLNCRITDTCDGIYIDTDDNLVKGNIISSVVDDAVHLSGNADNNLIIGNVIETVGGDAILIDAGADDNQLSDNAISSVTGNRVTDNGTNTIYGARYS